MPSIFDDKVRTSQRAMHRGESLYDYYDQSDRADIHQKRDALNFWASHYPAIEIPELRARMQKSTRQFQAAQVEIILHEIFRRSGYERQIHPLASTGKRFDLGVSKDNFSAFVEITALVASNEEVAVENRTAEIHNALNKLRLPPGHSLLLSIEESNNHSPSIQRIISKAINWVEASTPANIESPPNMKIEENGWSIEVTLINSGTDRVYERAVGAYSGGATWAAPTDDLRSKLQSKAQRYGRPDRPFIIAVSNFRMIDAEADEVAEALYGQWATIVDRTTFSTSRRFRPNGFFGHIDRPQNTAVSGVLIMPGEPYWSSTKGDVVPRLYLNPFARNVISANSLPFAIAYVDDNGSLQESEGPTIQALLAA